MDYSKIFVSEGMTYEAYRNLISELFSEGKTTGTDHSESMIHYTKMNIQRMNRVEKTVQLQQSMLDTLQSLKGQYRLLVITEGWCGDAAQIVPLFDKIASACPEKISLRLVLRDHNLPLIDAHLTNGGRSIPVLLVLDEEGNQVLKWGPRPQVLQSLVMEWKKEGADMAVLAEKLHSWYAKDRTNATQDELAIVISQLNQLVSP